MHPTLFHCPVETRRRAARASPCSDRAARKCCRRSSPTETRGPTPSRRRPSTETHGAGQPSHWRAVRPTSTATPECSTWPVTQFRQSGQVSISPRIAPDSMPHAARSRTGYQASRFVATDRGVSLRIASFLLDLAGRAHSFQEFLAGGVPVNDALAVYGLMTGDS